MVTGDIGGTAGKLDTVTVTFSETLAAYSAGTAPWTLANVPSGGTLSGVAVGGSTATLIVAEGAGAINTTVGSFTVALATNANGIRDPAGNLSFFAATAPTDGIAPVRTAMVMQDVDGDGKVDQVSVTFSETLASSTNTAQWSLASVPSGGTLSSVSTAGAVATLTIAEGAGAADTAVGSFTLALAASATGIRDAAGNQSSFAAAAPTDGAKPALVTMTMLDVNANGKVDRVTAVFSETLAVVHGGEHAVDARERAERGHARECGGGHDHRDADDHRGRGCGEHRGRELHGRARDERDRDPRRGRRTCRASRRRRLRTGRRRCARRW